MLLMLSKHNGCGYQQVDGNFKIITVSNHLMGKLHDL